MPAFTYTARDRSGQTVQSTLDAPSRKDALRLLAARGLQPVSIDESGAASAAKTKPARLRSTPGPASASAPQAAVANTPVNTRLTFTRRECLPFLQALADLISSGLSAGESLRLLTQRVRSPRLRALCARLWELVSEGATLSRALAAFPQVFESSIINLIQAGEATGNLREVLDRLIEHLSERARLKRELVNALAYPLLLMVIAGGVILFFLFFLLPRMESLFTALGSRLPVSTKILIGFANFSLTYGIFIAGALVFAGLAVWRWYKTPAGRAAIDALLLKIPLVGPFLVSRTVLSISQTLSILLENGITASEALKMTGRQINNRVHHDAFDEAISRVMEGESLSGALQRTDCFPPLVLDQLAIGENTGSIVPSLKKIAVNYQQIVTSRLTLFTNFLGTAVLLGTFGFIAFLAFAMISAIFGLSSSFSHRG
ncbi:type II secretion system F family protein [Termitidicoccus mucosus]|uniref:Secretion system protein n=1 Tax=Termitidicoccus mucosus TaxID=1184151 RepID=A0A178IMS1_9BACT|nr:secretion system protein [Opitutaceae bacterium TSB47]